MLKIIGGLQLDSLLEGNILYLLNFPCISTSNLVTINSSVLAYLKRTLKMLIQNVLILFL